MADEDYNDFDGGDVGSEEEPPKPEIEEEVGAEEEENEEIGFIEEIVFDRRDAFPFRILVEEEPPRNEPRKTPKFMTKDERAEILDTRVLQIRENAPVMVELEGETDPFEIATRELREGRIRFTICRTLPDGSCEYWRVDELFLEEGVDELIVEDSRRRQVGGD